MKYTYTVEDTVKRDELLAGPEHNTTIINVEVDSGTAILRGTILSGDIGGKFGALTSDKTKSIVIAAYDADSDATVVQAYSEGKFHREKLIYDASLDLNDYETEMRRQNLILTTLMEIY